MIQLFITNCTLDGLNDMTVVRYNANVITNSTEHVSDLVNDDLNHSLVDGDVTVLMLVC